VTATLFGAPTITLSQQPALRHEPPAGVERDKSYHGKRGYYSSAARQELREACFHKHELGEQGEGNCKRFRDNCHQSAAVIARTPLTPLLS